jgi:hypothetical protein
MKNSFSNSNLNKLIDASIITNMINTRVSTNQFGFTGRYVDRDEVNELAIYRVKKNFNDPNKRTEVLKHVYQSIIGGF